jgi:hypothetical protein
MVLFLIFTVPCVGILYIRHLHRSFFSVDEVRTSFLFGLLAQVIGFIPLVIVHSQMPVEYSPSRLFLSSWVTEVLVYWLLGLVAFLILHKRVLRLPTERGKWVETLAFWTGFLLLGGLYHAVYHFPGFTPYRLFLVPVLHLIILWGGALATFLLFALDRVVLRILVAILATLFTCLVALVPYLFSINYDGFGFLAFSLVLAVTLVSVFLVETKKLPVY